MKVYRKETHTNKYLDFNSHNPKQHKEAVVKSLLHRAKEIPTGGKFQQEEIEKVKQDLVANGYPPRFLQKVQNTRAQVPSSTEDSGGLAVLPYVKGVSEQLKRTLKRVKLLHH